jgi:kynurenine 3-monooxygenase
LSGDCIHTVKPYFGLGANSALEDVKILSDVIDSIPGGIDTDTTTAKVLTEYTKRRAMDSKTLVRLSRELDRPGKFGLITFIVPIILDGIFTKIAPKLFHPNTITMLQNENLTFQQVAQIKRQDRFLQSMILSSIVLGIVSGIKYIFHTLISATIF